MVSHSIATQTAALTSVMLMGAFVCAHLVNVAKVKNIPQSTAAIGIGAASGLIMHWNPKLFGSRSLLHFDPELCYMFMLPPIILEAGFSLDQINFFKNFKTIMWLAIGGTIMSAIITAAGLYLCSGCLQLEGSFSEKLLYCALLGTLLAAVDPVATLGVLGGARFEANEKLFSIVFGESLLNDTVSIVIFRTLVKAAPAVLMSADKTRPWSLLANTFCSFVYVTFISCIIGLSTGVIAYVAFKLADGMQKFPEYELGMLLLIAYFSFSIAELLEGSGIVSLFVTAVLLGHYNMSNLSITSQRTSTLLFKVMGVFSEAFIYLLFGTVTTRALLRHDVFDLYMIGLTIAFLMIARAVVVFPSASVINWLERKTRNAELEQEENEVMAGACMHALLNKHLTSRRTPLARTFARADATDDNTRRRISAHTTVPPETPDSPISQITQIATPVDSTIPPVIDDDEEKHPFGENLFGDHQVQIILTGESTPPPATMTPKNGSQSQTSFHTSFSQQTQTGELSDRVSPHGPSPSPGKKLIPKETRKRSNVPCSANVSNEQESGSNYPTGPNEPIQEASVFPRSTLSPECMANALAWAEQYTEKPSFVSRLSASEFLNNSARMRTPGSTRASHTPMACGIDLYNPLQRQILTGVEESQWDCNAHGTVSPSTAGASEPKTNTPQAAIFVDARSAMPATKFGFEDNGDALVFLRQPGQKIQEYMDELRAYRKGLKDKSRLYTQELDMPCQILVWMSGLRGAIAFVLALSVPEIGPSGRWNAKLLVTTTLATVVFTTVVLGSCIEYYALRYQIIRRIDSEMAAEGSCSIVKRMFDGYAQLIHSLRHSPFRRGPSRTADRGSYYAFEPGSPVSWTPGR